MGFKIQKELVYQIIFIICVAVPYLNNYELTFIVWSITALLTIRKKYSFSILKLIVFFLIILSIAFISSINQNFKSYNFIRDVAYLLKPVLGLLVGYQLCKSHFKNPLNTAINAGVFIAVVHLLIVGYTILFRSVRTMHELRMYAGYFSDFEIYILILLIFHREFQINIPLKKIRWFIVIISLSSFFYLARTNFIQFIILFLALKGYFVLTKKSIVVLTTIIITTLVGYSAIYVYNPNRGAKGFEAFLFKIKNAPIEPFKTKIDVTNWKDFNDNYRSYENILTIRQVGNAGVQDILIGQGLGSSIDLKKEVWLQSSYMRYIPFLHNGFMTIFLKSGLLGVLILLLSIIYFFRIKKSDIKLIQNINYLFLGTGLFLFISYWVFMGFYFTVDTKTIIIGFLISYKELYLKSNKILDK
ncbi:MAG TPA: hypothetical protein P5188_08310 [Flavobacterium sp.]|nr:hypothetical protein [Flavobacterium sp.]HRZ32295.1 hypothetical protein [Flavobacterium sp.]